MSDVHRYQGYESMRAEDPYEMARLRGRCEALDDLLTDCRRALWASTAVNIALGSWALGATIVALRLKGLL